MYLTSFILTNNDQMLIFDQRYQFIARLMRLISRISPNYNISLSYKQHAVELTAVLIGWNHARLSQLRAGIQVDPQCLRMY
jgi:hypothetical protein